MRLSAPFSFGCDAKISPSLLPRVRARVHTVGSTTGAALGAAIGTASPEAVAYLRIRHFDRLYAQILFKNFDVNNDGYLEVPEAQKALDYIGHTHFSIKETVAKVTVATHGEYKVSPEEFTAIYAAMLAQHNVTEEELAAMAAAAESGAALRLEENVWRRNSGQMTSPRALHHPGPLPAETAPIRRPSSAYLDDLLEA